MRRILAENETRVISDYLIGDYSLTEEDLRDPATTAREMWEELELPRVFKAELTTVDVQDLEAYLANRKEAVPNECVPNDFVPNDFVPNAKPN